MAEQFLSTIQNNLPEVAEKAGISYNGYGKSGAGDDFFLSYPLKRNGKEDSMIFQAVKYLPQNQKGHKTSLTMNEAWLEAKTAIEKQNAARVKLGLEEELTTEGVIKELHATYPNGDRVYNVGNMIKDLKLGSSVSSRYDGFAGHKHNAKTKFYVELPIPNQLSDTQGVEYAQSKMNAAEMVAFDQAQALMEDPGAALKDVQEAANAARIGYLNAQDFGDGNGNSVAGVVRAALAGTALNAFGSNFTTNSLISRATGQILNSNKELLFEGVSLRSFNFEFTFAPRSKDESVRVMKIIRSLKAAMAPKAGKDYVPGSDGFRGTGGLFLNAPDVFLIKYLKAGKEHPFLHKFKPCALTSLRVNYTGSNVYSSYEDGTPTIIKMQMVFNEMNPIYSEDYEDAGEGVGY